MAKQLNLDEMLEVIQELEPQLGQKLQKRVENLGSLMADYIALRLGVKTMPATFQGTAFAGTCAPFMPACAGQECPDVLKNYDPAEWGE